MRMIDGDEVQKKIVKKAEEWQGINPDVAYGIMYGHAVITDAPTIEPKRGRWIEDEYGIPHCSRCGTINNTVYRNYCPNCGAKMMDEVTE